MWMIGDIILKFFFFQDIRILAQVITYSLIMYFSWTL